MPAKARSDPGSQYLVDTFATDGERVSALAGCLLRPFALIPHIPADARLDRLDDPDVVRGKDNGSRTLGFRLVDWCQQL
jgi:hypothetical protein